jgi:uncharacterized membrane protein
MRSKNMKASMKQSWEVSSRRIAAVLTGWLMTANVLVWVDWWPAKVVLFLCITLLPGTALLRLLRIALKNVSTRIVYSFGLSLLILMLSGLAASSILHLFVSRPLELPGALIAWNIVTGLIVLAAIITNRTAVRVQKWSVEDFPKPAFLLVAASVLLPCGAALGAFRLNNGGDGLVALITLSYAAALIMCAFLLRRRLPDGLLAWLIFIVGLSVLLMTSLRGWDIVGHDIEREFRVYTLTHMHGFWDISMDRNPYNACLSITILPEMFTRLLNISGLVVFKVILQVIFAVCPAVVYLLLRRYTSKLAALAGSLLFICYPTFINDSAMLTRQSVAYLFFALALLIMTNKVQKKRYKLLFLLCSLGVILSHYSTSYLFVGLFAVAVICKLCMAWWRRRRSPELDVPRTVLSPLFAGLLVLITFVWYTQITATSSGLLVTLRKSITNIPAIFSDDNKSTDTAAVLLFAGGKSQVNLFESYVTSVKPGADVATVDPKYLPRLTDDNLPLTHLGKKARAIGIDPSLITALRQNFARFLQLLALVSVAFVTYRMIRRRPKALGADFVCLSIAGVVLLALLVILPILSIDYGILRAFHQAIVFLILPMMLFAVWVGRFVKAWMRTAITVSGSVFLFLTFSGVFAQMLGGVSPHLSMNNSGLYYGLYYSPEADSRAFTWLKEHVPGDSDVRAANFNRAFMHDPSYPFSVKGILPSQLGPGSYVYLDPAQVLRQRLYAHYENSPLIMTFPLKFYDETKDRIYSTTSTGVYR